jgi:coenzyme F420-0:L-glutamate ligase / coenzyme F420-1:gamma-L-glutamate ligase
MSKRRPRSSRTGTPALQPGSIQLLPILGLPEFRPGDELARAIVTAAGKSTIAFEHGDVLVIAQKIVSKVEGRVVDLSTIPPSQAARDLAAKLNKDARLVEVIVRESRRIVRSEPVLIVETHHGFVCANAGVDQSNLPGDNNASLLPRDPDASARKLAASLRKLTRQHVAVLISDTFGRPWRLGLTNVAIGAAGLPALLDLRGSHDLHGKPLHATILAIADELAAAAGLVMAKSAGIPAVIVRGYHFRPSKKSAATQIIRPATEDLFR